MTYHITIAREGRFPLFRSEAESLAILRGLCRSIGSSLLLFSLADDHLHFVVEGDLHRAGHLASTVQQLLRHRLRSAGGSSTQRAHLVAVDGRTHLVRLLAYLVRQAPAHGLGPATTWSGSCHVDLLGARQLRGFDPLEIREALPRLREHEIWRAAELPTLAPDLEFDRHAPHELVAAACATWGVPDLESIRNLEAEKARRIAITLLKHAGLDARRTAEAVGCSVRTSQRARASRPCARDLRAVGLQLAIRAHVRSQHGLPPRDDPRRSRS